METGTSRLAAGCIAALALAAGGCGASGAGRGTASTGPPVGSGAGAAHAGTLADLHPSAPPPHWGVARIGAGGALYYPPGWRRASGDAGTATAVLVDTRRQIVGYLNLTPRQSRETLAGWASFRVSHNAAEGERHVRLEQVAYGVRFRTGSGTCVRDSYTTSSRARFIELACLVRGTRATSVIVGAAPPRTWITVAPLLDRAISALVT